jgi:hypothetical protein
LATSDEEDVNKSGKKKIWVGQSFEHITKETTGGELRRNEDGDVCDPRYSLTSEVKARARQAGDYPLDTAQVDRYSLSVGGFPWEKFKHGLYWFYAYNNPVKREGKKSRTALSKHITEAAVREYVSNNILWCVVVDLSIVAHWRDAPGRVVTGSIQSHADTPTIDVKHRDIEHLANGGFHEELAKYELDPERFDVLSGKVNLDFRPTLFERYQLNFPITAVVLKEDVSTVRKMFAQRGHKLRRRNS